MRLGLVGYRAPTGIGYLCRRFAASLPVHAWLVLPNRNDDPRVVDARMILSRGSGRSPWMDRFLCEVDVVLAVERDWKTFGQAKRVGKRTVLLAMGEWFDPDIGQLTDLIVAPNEECLGRLREWGFGDKSTLLRVPISRDEFVQKKRGRCESLLFCDGWGGVGERKGAPVVEQVADRLPEGAVHVRSQRRREWSSNVRVLPTAKTPALLYEQATVCLQPSRWEGLGLQQLEAMACGVPVVTCDAGPMREATLMAHGVDSRRLLCRCAVTETKVNKLPWTRADADVDHLVELCESLLGSDVGDLSDQASAYVDQHHGAACLRGWREALGCS